MMRAVVLVVMVGAVACAGPLAGLGFYAVPSQDYGAFRGFGLIPYVYTGYEFPALTVGLSVFGTPGEESELGWPTSYTLWGTVKIMLHALESAGFRLYAGPTLSWEFVAGEMGILAALEPEVGAVVAAGYAYGPVGFYFGSELVPRYGFGLTLVAFARF